MKRTLSLCISITLSIVCSGQKKPLDHSVYDGWQNIPTIVQSEDGSVLAYRITPQEGDAELIFVNTDDRRESRIPRGGVPIISADGKWAVFSISAPFADTRKAKIEKKSADKMPKDSVGYINLGTFEIKKLPDASKLKASLVGHNVFAYETGRKDSVSLVIFDIESGKADSLRHVSDYAFSEDGCKLAAAFKKDKKDSLSTDKMVMFSLPSMEMEILSEGERFYGNPTFNAEGTKMAFLSSKDTAETGNKHCAVHLYEQLTTGKGKKAITKTSTEVLVSGEYNLDGLYARENSTMFFSAGSNRLILNIGECLPPDDTTLVSFETAQLDIWNWDIYLTPPMQKARLSSLRNAGYTSVINLNVDRHNIIKISRSVKDRVSFVDGGEADWCIVTNNEPYQISSTWDSNSLNDVFKVSLADGSRKTVFNALNGYGSLSPEGKYYVWYSEDDSNWHSLRFSDGAIFNLTADVDGIFYDDEDDHPMPAPYIDTPHWIEGDDAFLLADKFDIFKFSPDGSRAINMTEGTGRAANQVYRYATLAEKRLSPALKAAGVKRTVGRKEKVYLTVFDRTDKRNGLAWINASSAGVNGAFVDEHSYPTVSVAGGTVAFRKGNFKETNDVYYTKDFFATSVRLSSINPQQAEYRWGDVRLVHWDAYDGTHLDGLLYTPEDMDPSVKYPMMIYFYEKNAQTLYNYSAPAPSRSIINIPFYVSRGYVVFVPDIVYTVGHPGESAYNCICAGAEAMCRQFSFIDKDKMAIQGQSWGGYQVAYLVTRTDMFAAAGAGAPVGNMTSAYGGIRWESGMVRAMQYEHGQSRIGASLWDKGGLDLYIENSPVFHTENVSTPTLIMHNDNDGAVPWYQGIEFFMSLRRFEHPAWLLEYNNESHNLVERRNCKDLSVRLQQFFDHYLKGAPLPAWMKTGVPTTRKGQYFGFENAE